MKSAEFERLLSNLRSDNGLRGEFEQLAGDREKTMHLAVAKGYRLSQEEGLELARSFQELSDEDLDQAAGGAWNDPPPPTTTG